MGLFSLASPAFVFFGAATGVLAVPVLRRAPQPSLGRRKARVQPGACCLTLSPPPPQPPLDSHKFTYVGRAGACTLAGHPLLSVFSGPQLYSPT